MLTEIYSHKDQEWLLGHAKEVRRFIKSAKASDEPALIPWGNANPNNEQPEPEERGAENGTGAQEMVVERTERPVNPSTAEGYYLPKGHPDHPFTAEQPVACREVEEVIYQGRTFNLLHKGDDYKNRATQIKWVRWQEAWLRGNRSPHY